MSLWDDRGGGDDVRTGKWKHEHINTVWSLGNRRRDSVFSSKQESKAGFQANKSCQAKRVEIL